MNLQNKVAWITGGARMGEAIAKALSRQGCRIVLTYRSSRKSAEETLGRLKLPEDQTLLLPCDLSKQADIQAVVKQIEDRFKRLDVLVQMASTFDNHPFFSENGFKAWEEQSKVHADVTLWTSAAVAPL